ncbi:MAG: transcriptional coactivator p15/PC4 family protein [Dehalococcoidia bacterium]
MDEKLIAAFEKNNTEQVRLYLTEFQGRPMIDLRVWAETQDGTWIRTRKGITMSADLIGNLKAVVDEAEGKIGAEIGTA